MRKGQFKDKTGIDAVLSLLDCFSVERSRRSLSDICEETGFPKANVLRYLKALQRAGLIRQELKTKKYTIGYKALELAYISNQSINLREISLPFMHHLRDVSRETVSLMVEDNDAGVCIERLEAKEELKFFPPVGQRRPLYAGASRKVLLAGLSNERIERIIDKGLIKISENTVTDPVVLRNQVEEIRRNGYAISDSEHNQGVKAVAVPIWDRNRNVVAALSITGPAFRITGDMILHFISLLKEASEVISKQMGYQE